MSKKEKKVEARDVFRGELAQMIMRERCMTGIRRTKEGLVVTVDGQDLVIRVVQKKERIEAADVVETIAFEGDIDELMVEVEDVEDDAEEGEDEEESE